MLTPSKFALQSIAKHGFRSLIFFILVFIASACVYGVGFFTENMKSGVVQASGRIGADMIAVPSDYSDNAKDALFSGNACTILFSENLIEQIGKTEGVAHASSQLYLETLSFDCCAAAGVQIIAFDPTTDFTVGEWIKGRGIENLGANEMIAGSSSGMKKGDKFTFFGHTFTVAAVLEETGMGYDQSAFVSYEAANQITSSDEYDLLFGQRTDLASMIMIDTENGYDIDKVKESISNAFSGVSVYSTDSLVEALTKQLGYFRTFGYIMDIFVILLAAVSLFALITITFHQRRNRVGSLLSVGVGRGKIIQMFLLEYLYLTLFGTAAGVGIAAIFVLPLHNVIKQSLDMPYKFIGAGKMCVLCLIVLTVNLFILIVACSFTFVKIMKTEPAILSEEQT